MPNFKVRDAIFAIQHWILLQGTVSPVHLKVHTTNVINPWLTQRIPTPSFPVVKISCCLLNSTVDPEKIMAWPDII